MFGGAQSAAGMTCEGYWKQLTITFKYLLVLVLGLEVIGLFTPKLIYLLANVIQQTVNHLQIWRLLTSFLANVSLVSLLFDLLILSSFLPDLEKRYSTAYMLAEIFIQNIYCNAVFVLVGEALSLMGLINSTGLITYGLTNVMLIFLWQRVSLNPQEMTRLWCLPCIMPLAYLPWCFITILVVQGRIDVVIGCLLGYYQHMILKRSLFVFPIRLYNSIQSCLPLKMKQQQGFIAVRAVEHNLQAISVASNYSQANAPLDSNELMSEVVSAGGVPIGGSQAQSVGNYRQHWLEQEGPHQQTGDETTRALSPQAQLEQSSHALNGKYLNSQTNNQPL